MTVFDPTPCVVDGALAPDGRVSLRATSGALAAGEGLFETLPVIGGAPKFLAAHLRRLDDAARALEFGPGPGAAEILGDVRLLTEACGGGDFSLRVLLLRDADRTRRIATADPLPADVGRPVALVRAAPRFDGARTLAGFKTINYLASRLAHREAARRGADEALFCLPDGTALEGTRSTLFLVRDGALITPPLSLPILPGVTRDVILAAARAAQIPVREAPFPASDLAEADEAFISASVRGLRPIASYEGAPLRGVDGPTTRRLREGYRAAFAAG